MINNKQITKPQIENKVMELLITIFQGGLFIGKEEGK